MEGPRATLWRCAAGAHPQSRQRRWSPLPRKNIGLLECLRLELWRGLAGRGAEYVNSPSACCRALPQPAVTEPHHYGGLANSHRQRRQRRQQRAYDDCRSRTAMLAVFLEGPAAATDSGRRRGIRCAG